MTRDDDFRVRPGRIRSPKAQRALPFVAQALAAAQKAGGRISSSGKITSGHGRGPTFARGRVASLRANRIITSRTRFCTVKARVVRNRGERGPLGRHLRYLRREGVTRDGEHARMFGPETDDADAKEFADRCKDDRHHFRFIVSPEDATDMEDLKRFTRELLAQAEKDLGAKLDWVAVDHWNTDNPHGRMSRTSPRAVESSASVSGVIGSAPILASRASWLRLLDSRERPSSATACASARRSSTARPVRRVRTGGAAPKTLALIYVPSGVPAASRSSRARSPLLNRIANGASRLRLGWTAGGCSTSAADTEKLPIRDMAAPEHHAPGAQDSRSIRPELRISRSKSGLQGPPTSFCSPYYPLQQWLSGSPPKCTPLKSVVGGRSRPRPCDS